MAIIYIDNKAYEVSEEDNLLHAALLKGVEIPYFCWHPAMGSIGSCRQCAVQHLASPEDAQGRTVMACMTKVSDQMRLALNHPKAVEFRKQVIEWLMLNHPHDCPVCDEGGECHLQDMTVLVGHRDRKSRFKKRTFNNQNLGPFVKHEMNRCITCYRCVRYYKDYAGGEDLNAYKSADQMYFGRAEEGTLESPFSGNLVEVCPTGVFTDKPFSKQFIRKWDLQTAPSICHLCGVGCHIYASERYGKLRRVTNRFSLDINGYFLCDRGRFGTLEVNQSTRFKATKPLEEAYKHLHDYIKQAKSAVGLASPRASLEANWALKKTVGEQFFVAVDPLEWKVTQKAYEYLQTSGLKTASLKDIEKSDGVIILGEDVLNTAPRMALSIRQVIFEQAKKKAKQAKIDTWNDTAVRNFSREKTGPIVELNPFKTGLSDICESSKQLSVADIGKEIDEWIKGRYPPVLQNAQDLVIVCGISLRSELLLDAVFALGQYFKAQGKNPLVSLVFPGPNYLGLAMLGARPLDEMPKEGDLLIGLEEDLKGVLGHRNAQALLKEYKNKVWLDFYLNPTFEDCTLVLKTPSFVQQSGTQVNNEGRLQRFYSVYPKPTDSQEAFRWFLGPSITLPEVNQKMAEEYKTLQPFYEHVHEIEHESLVPIPRQALGYSGRTAIQASQYIQERAPSKDFDTPLNYSMEGQSFKRDSSLVGILHRPRFNSNQSINLEAQAESKPFFMLTSLEEKTVAFKSEVEVFPQGIFQIVPLQNQPLYFVMNEEDAHRNGIEEGQEVAIWIKDIEIKQSVQFKPYMAKGCIGIFLGSNELGRSLPQVCRMDGGGK